MIKSILQVSLILSLLLVSSVALAEPSGSMNQDMLMSATIVLHGEGVAGTAVRGLYKVTANPPYIYFAMNVVMDMDQSTRQYMLVVHAITSDLVGLEQK